MLTQEHLTPIYERLERIEQRMNRMATTQAEFDAALQAEDTAIENVATSINQTIADLIAKAQANPTVDLSAELADVQARTAALAALSQTVTQDDPGQATPAAPVTAGVTTEQPAPASTETAS